MPVYSSLLRGINVGGNKRIKMAELQAVYEALGLTRVRTLLQSGNVVFEAEQADADALGQRIEAAIMARFGFEARIVMRTPAQLAAVIAESPFSAEQRASPDKILVMFLLAAPEPERMAALTAGHSGPEQMTLKGRELFVFFAEGVGRSKLSGNGIEKALDTVGTMRNWNTIHKLHELAQSFGDAG
jgi:uncharacterized protein (DUF1697 family)